MLPTQPLASEGELKLLTCSAGKLLRRLGVVPHVAAVFISDLDDGCTRGPFSARCEDSESMSAVNYVESRRLVGSHASSHEIIVLGRSWCEGLDNTLLKWHVFMILSAARRERI